VEISFNYKSESGTVQIFPDSVFSEKYQTVRTVPIVYSFALFKGEVLQPLS
jgi:hypothetical protein